MSLPPPPIVSPEAAAAIAAAIDAVDTALGRPPFVGPFTTLTTALTTLSQLFSEHLPESECRKVRLDALVAPGSSGVVSAAIKTTLPILAMAYPKGIPADTPIDQKVLGLFIRCMSFIADVSTIPLAELVRTGLQHLEPPTGDMVLLCARSKRMDAVTARHLLRVSDLVDEAVVAPITTTKGGKGPAQTPKAPKGKKGTPSRVSTCDPSVIIAISRVALQSPDIDAGVRTELMELLRECVFNDISLPNALQSLLPTSSNTPLPDTTVSFKDMSFVANLFDSLITPNISSPHSLVPLLEAHYAAGDALVVVVERSLSQTCLKAVTSCITTTTSTSSTTPSFDSLFKSLGMLGRPPVFEEDNTITAVNSGSDVVKLHPAYLWESLSPSTAVLRIKGVLHHCLSELESLLLQYPPTATTNKPIMGSGALAALSTSPDTRLFPIVMGAIPAIAALANVASNSGGIGGLKGLVLNPIEVTLITEMLLLAALYIPRLPQLTAAIAPPPIKSAKASKAAKASDPPPLVPILPPLPTSLSANTFLTLSAPIFGMLWGCKFTTKLPIHSTTPFKAAAIEALITNTLRVCLSRDELLLTRLVDSRITKGDGLSLEASSELSSKVGAVLILFIELYKRMGALVSLCKGIEGGFGPITTQHPLGASIGLALSADAELASGTTLRGFTRHWLRFIIESRVVPLTAILDCANQLPFQKVLPALNAAVATARKGKGSGAADVGPGKGGKGGGKGSKGAASATPPAAPPGTTNIVDEGAVVYASPTDKVALKRMLVRCLVFGATDHAGTTTTTKAVERETTGHDESVARLVALINIIRTTAIGSSARHPHIIKSSLIAFRDLVGASELLSEVYAAATTASSDFLSDIVTVAVSTSTTPTDADSGSDDASHCAQAILTNLAKVELERSRPTPPDTLRGVPSSSSSDKWAEVVLHIEELKRRLVSEGFGAGTTTTQDDITIRSQALIDALNRRRQEITIRLQTIATEKAKRDRELRGKLHEQARVQEAVRAAFEARHASQEEARMMREEKRVKALLHAKDLETNRRIRAVEKRKLQVQAARERDGLTDSLAMYLESALRIGHFEALTIVNRLRPKISHLSADDVHEYIVTGATKVPADMLARLVDEEEDVSAAATAAAGDTPTSDDRNSRHATEVRSKVRERYFAEANGEVSFWDMVERATREENGGAAVPAAKAVASCVTGEAARHEASKQQSLAATQDAERRAKINSMSFHYRVALFLDAFDYSSYDPERGNVDPTPDWNGGVGPLTRDAVQAVFPRETAQEFGFFDAGSCAFELSQKKLLVVNKGVYTLTPIGAAYHARFAKPENSFETHRLAHLARARAALGRLPSSSPQSGMGSVVTSSHHQQEAEEDDGDAIIGDDHIESDYEEDDDDDEEESDEDISSEEGGTAPGRMFFGDELI